MSWHQGYKHQQKMTWSWFPAVIWIFTYQLITVSGSHQEYLRLTNARVSLFCGATTTHTRIQRTLVLVLVLTLVYSYEREKIPPLILGKMCDYTLLTVLWQYQLFSGKVRWGDFLFLPLFVSSPDNTISTQLSADGFRKSFFYSVEFDEFPPSLPPLPHNA